MLLKLPLLKLKFKRKNLPKFKNTLAKAFCDLCRLEVHFSTLVDVQSNCCAMRTKLLENFKNIFFVSG